MAHYVYLIGNLKLNWFKIGRTTNPENRLKTIQHGLPFPVEKFHQHEVASFDLVSALENDLLSWYSATNIRGEWFMDINFTEFPDVAEVLAKNLLVQKNKVTRKMRVLQGKLTTHRDPLVHRRLRGHLLK